MAGTCGTDIVECAARIEAAVSDLRERIPTGLSTAESYGVSLRLSAPAAQVIAIPQIMVDVGDFLSRQVS